MARKSRNRIKGSRVVSGRRKSTRSSTPATVIRRLRTVSQMHQEHDEFSEGSLRWMIFKARENGLEQLGAIVRIGRRVYIDPDRFFEWVAAQQPLYQYGGDEATSLAPPMAATPRE